jgi:hypothetical protein
MHPRIEELTDRMAASRAELRAAVDAVPRALHNTQPAQGRWSVVNVIEHLVMVETGIAGLFKKRVDEARTSGLGHETETSSVLDQPVLAPIGDRTRRIVGSDAVRPPSTLDTETAWQQLTVTREQLRDVVLSADGLALGAITHPHRVFGVLNLYQWLVFLAGHESRHAAQVREIGAQL